MLNNFFAKLTANVCRNQTRFYLVHLSLILVENILQSMVWTGVEILY